METLMRRLARVMIPLVLPIVLPSSARAQGTETVIYFHTDAVGSVRMTTDANGQVLQRYDYLPFGEPWPATPAQPEDRRFIGQELDAETQLNHFGARQYLPQTGRFTRADDPGYGNPFDPQSMNLYAYAYNNPFRHVDPTGHAPCPTDYCQNEYVSATVPDIGLINFFIDAFMRPWERNVSPVVERVRQVIVAPRDPGCMSQTVGAYGAIGGMAGAYVGGTGGGALGFAGGSLALPGGGSLAGGMGGSALGSALGGSAGAVAGLAIGSAVGSVGCMSSVTGAGGGGGGGGGAGRTGNREFKEAVRRIEKALGRTLRPDQRDQLHRAISKEGLTLSEIVDLGIAMFR
jgi:RHS repeat-associated protein